MLRAPVSVRRGRQSSAVSRPSRIPGMKAEAPFQTTGVEITHSLSQIASRCALLGATRRRCHRVTPRPADVLADLERAA